MRMNNTHVIRPVLGLLLCAVVCASCGSDVVRQGSGSSYLIVDGMTAASGAKSDVFGQVLQSDVITNVKMTVGSGQVNVPTVFEDLGQVAIRLGMKDVMVAPTLNNLITVNRYHVRYVRADGRNAQGVDVPYEFDGAVTGTVYDGAPTSLTFVLVRAQAKKEAPLAALVGGGGALVISTIAEVTFYGRDQAGNSVSITGSISINFADWGDPQ
jgi:hypothetical protein